MVKHLFLFYLFTTQTPAPTLSPLSDLQLVDTKRAISTTCSQSLLWWVSRYAVSVVIYLDYPRPIITTTPLHSPLPSMQGTHFKDQARPPPVSLISPEPHIGSDNLSLLWGRSHWVLTTRWNAWWYPRVQVASPVFPELRRRGSENGRNLYSWDVHRLVGGRALQINQDNTVWSDFSDWGVGGTYWKEGALALPGAATVKAAGQLRASAPLHRGPLDAILPEEPVLPMLTENKPRTKYYQSSTSDLSQMCISSFWLSLGHGVGVRGIRECPHSQPGFTT